MNRSSSFTLNEEQWNSLRTSLLSFVLSRVRRAHLTDWEGQEQEVAQDITSSSICKLIEYTQLAERKGIAIGSIERLAIVVAKNQFQDTLRKERRLVRGETVMNTLETFLSTNEADDPAEFVPDRMHYETIFRQVARLIPRFPAKLRRAIMIDFASRMKKFGDFDARPTGLRLAFEEVGIHLEEYLTSIPNTPVLRSRQASLASLGYKRLAAQRFADLQTFRTAFSQSRKERHI
jgi:DNA-directed RNA polymerase specialized sigma24 family protein